MTKNLAERIERAFETPFFSEFFDVERAEGLWTVREISLQSYPALVMIVRAGVNEATIFEDAADATQPTRVTAYGGEEENQLLEHVQRILQKHVLAYLSGSPPVV